MSSLALKEWRPYSPNVEIRVENKDYVVKTVTSWREWYAVLRFRKEVFVTEYGAGRASPFSVDIDRFDWKCDQLIVMEKSSQRIVGCYRIMCTLFQDKFYSETEFNIDHVKRMPGTKVELGRACVHPAFRSGAVIQLLWRGIAEYIREVRAEYAFGCTSIKTTDHLIARKIELMLQEREATAPYPHVAPLAGYRFRENERREQSRILLLEEADRAEAIKQFPPLLKFYLKLGAKFCGPAAVDRKFNCLDFFTLFDFTNLSKQMRAKYNLEPQPLDQNLTDPPGVMI